MDTQSPEYVFQRYQQLQRYVGWTAEDAERVGSLAPLIRPAFEVLVDDFYATIEREPQARKVITGGSAQIERLKVTLHGWLEELFSGVYDEQYVTRRWKVGWRHVEIGLDQVYTNVALSRLRKGLVETLQQKWQSHQQELQAAVRSLNQLLDLDLAIIEDAYQAEHLARQQRSERLAAIGQVAGGVAHELRNPLNVVKTSVYYLLHSRNPSPEKTAEHLGRIERQVGLADNVITALTDFAKLPIPDLRPVGVYQCLQEALETCSLPESVRVGIECPADLPAVLADQNQLRIVLGNLIRNARDAMPQGGQLLLSARPDGSRVQVSVADTGQGIAPENLNRISEPLYSTRARGIGLGLAITRSILEKHNAQLQVASELGQGATFTVHLLAAETRPAD